MLYKLFGINAELLIDHSWGWEPCTMQSIKSYKPQSNSISSGQVLHCSYDYEKTKLIVKEMAELLSLELVSKKLVTNQLVLTIGYDADNLKINNSYNGEITTDYYGRQVPKHAHGTINLSHQTSSTKIILENAIKLFERIINKNLLIRRINITANNVINEQEIITNEQLDLFTNYDLIMQEHEKEQKEKELQKAILNLKQKYGKNSIVKGMNFLQGATTLERNNQIGGHKS